MPRATRKRKLVQDEDVAATSRTPKKDSTPEEIKARPKVSTKKKTTMSVEPVKVYLRIRPLNDKELEAAEEEAVHMKTNSTVLAKAPESSQAYKNGKREEGKYEFTEVFDSQVTQKDLFQCVAQPLLRSFIEGHNALLFAHGCTNAGKTYTISGTRERPGLLPRIFDTLFNSIQPGKEPQRTPFKDRTVIPIDESMRHIVSISIIEVYNEHYYDLLVPINSERTIMKSCTDRKGRVIVKGLTEEIATSAEKAQMLIEQSRLNRMVGATALNADSSRSHAVYQIKLIKIPKQATKRDIQQNPGLLSYSIMSVVDLAGSERTKKSNVRGDMMKQSSSINKSLMTFGQCLNMLQYNQKHRNKLLVPFRESKLTHLFQDYFTGNGRAAMVACISPGSGSFDETVGSLKFAAIAREITTTSRIDMGTPSRLASNTPKRRKTDSHFLTSATPRSKSSGRLQRGPDMEEDEAVDLGTAQEPIIKKLREKLAEKTRELEEERMRSAQIEQDVREELINQAAEMMEQLEERFETTRIQEMMMIEDKCDQKLAGVIETLNNAHCFEEDGLDASTKAAIDELERERETLASQNHEITNEVRQLQVQLSATEADRDQLLEKVDMLEATVAKTIGVAKQMRMKLTASEMEREQLEEERGKLEATVQKLVNNGLVATSSGCTEVNDSAEEIMELTNQVAELQKELEILRGRESERGQESATATAQETEMAVEEVRRPLRSRRKKDGTRINLNVRKSNGGQAIYTGSIQKSHTGGVKCNFSSVSLIDGPYGSTMMPAMLAQSSSGAGALMDSCTTSEIEGISSSSSSISSSSTGSLEDVPLDDPQPEKARKGFFGKRASKKSKKAKDDVSALSTRNAATKDEDSIRKYFGTPGDGENAPPSKSGARSVIKTLSTPIARKTRSRTRGTKGQ